MKDNTFAAIGVVIEIGIAVVMFFTWLSDKEVVTGDWLLCLFAMVSLGILCYLAHNIVNKKKGDDK